MAATTRCALGIAVMRIPNKEIDFCFLDDRVFVTVEFEESGAEAINLRRRERGLTDIESVN